jgi:hypothetical protein
MAGINLIRNRLYEKYKRQGLSDEEALLKADRESRVKKAKTPTKKRSKNLLARAITKGKTMARELYYGPETYLHETPEERRKRVARERE